MLRVFWKLWCDDCLLRLRERYQNFLKSKRIRAHLPPNIGDIVLVKDDLPWGCLRTGKILQLVPSRDREIRSAKVLLPSGRVIHQAELSLFVVST